jgi:release factor glutamine methyltransferase
VSLHDRDALAELLAGGGFIAAHAEAEALLATAAGDQRLLGTLLERRLSGEPLAWVTGSTSFCGLSIRLDPGVYVPRPHTEALALRAAGHLRREGVAIDLCTGSGAVAKVLAARRPGARVVASDVDERAIACAQSNGVEAYHGDLFAPLPGELRGRTDVVVAVVPYVPSTELRLLQRDTLTFEAPLAYEGGPDGTDVLRRVVDESTRFLRLGGKLLLELGGDQAELLRGPIEAAGYGDAEVLVDENNDVRGVEATLGAVWTR